MSGKLSTMAAFIDGVYYRVEDFPWKEVESKGPYALKKGVAYRYQTDLTKGLFPYRGIADGKFSYNTAKIGIWFRKTGHDSFKLFIIRPSTPKEANEYKLGKERDIVAAVMENEFLPDQFADSDLAAADAGVDVYRPPIRTGDDQLNQIVKLMIRAKGAPFEPYGRRLQAMAVDQRPGTERSNAKNNARRGINNNSAMSMSKATQYLDVWQGECAIVVRDAPHAMHPMKIPKGKMLVIYPNGIPFAINNEDLIDVSDMIADAIAEKDTTPDSTEEE